LFDRHGEQQQIEPAVQQFADKRSGQRLPQPQFEFRILRAQGRQHSWRRIGREGRNHAQPQGPAQAPVASLHAFDQIANLLDNALAAPREFVPLRGQRHALARSLDERRAELGLKAGDLHRKRPLRDRGLPRRGRPP
jgi:hypothetical protein